MQRHSMPMRGFESGRRKRILIADDDKALVSILEQELDELGLFDLRTAHSGYEAGMVTADYKPDLLLLDYNLGDVTGVEVVELVRQNPALKHIRIILMSGMLKGKKAKEAVQSGADDFISKPFQFDDLKEIILRLLRLA